MRNVKLIESFGASSIYLFIRLLFAMVFVEKNQHHCVKTISWLLSKLSRSHIICDTSLCDTKEIT